MDFLEHITRPRAFSAPARSIAWIQAVALVQRTLDRCAGRPGLLCVIWRPVKNPLIVFGRTLAHVALPVMAIAGCERATPQTTPISVVHPSSPPASNPVQPAASSIACIAPSRPSADFYGGADFPSASCRARANELVAKMTPREKAAHMFQLARDQGARPQEVAALSLGSVLSGGGMGPWGQNSPANWAAMVQSYHKASLKTRLGIPLIYGVDAVHGHGNVRGAVIFPHNIGLGASRDALWY